jgi:hypothetical protein
MGCASVKKAAYLTFRIPYHVPRSSGQRGDGGIFFGWDVAVAASGPLNSSLHVITTRPPFFLFATIGGTTRFKSHYAFARYTRSLAHSLQSSSEHSLEAEETCGHEQGGGGEEAPPP